MGVCPHQIPILNGSRQKNTDHNVAKVLLITKGYPREVKIVHREVRMATPNPIRPPGVEHGNIGGAAWEPSSDLQRDDTAKRLLASVAGARRVMRAAVIPMSPGHRRRLEAIGGYKRPPRAQMTSGRSGGVLVFTENKGARAFR